MSKNLRVFLLSVLVVIMAVSSVCARELTITNEITLGNGASYDVATKTLTFQKNGILRLPYNFNGTIVSVDVVSMGKAASVDKVVLIVPNSNSFGAKGDPNVPGNGVLGSWDIKFEGASASKVQTLEIEQDTTNSAIIVSQSGDEPALKWTVSGKSKLIVNIPLRAVDADHPFGISVDILAGGKFAFAESGLIFGRAANTASGFYGKPSYINAFPGAGTLRGGEYIVKNTSALQGNLNVNVYASSDVAYSGTLTVDVPDAPTHDLKGAKLFIDGNFNVVRDLTLVGGPILVKESGDKFVKSGDKKLTIGANAFHVSFDKITVGAGTLKLNGTAAFDSFGTITAQPSVSTDKELSIVVNKGATLDLAAKSVEQSANGHFNLTVLSGGTAVLADHAVYARAADDGKYKEIYPYENYREPGNAMRIDVDSFDINAAGTVTINGRQAVTRLTGAGTVQLAGDTTSADSNVLIFAKPTSADFYLKFTGTITGSHANVGFWEADDVSRDLFKRGTVSIDNLLIYGENTTLHVSGDTFGKNASTIGSIWLRSDRPGAANKANPRIRSLNLTVGRLVFEANSEVEVSGLKIDSTMSKVHMATISLDKHANVKLSNVTLYANRDLDFNGDFGTHNDGSYTGMYAVQMGSPHKTSRLTINSDTLTGDGIAADVDRVFAIQIMESSDVIMQGTAQYPFAQNNSVFVRKDAKLEVYADATIKGNLTFDESTKSVDVELWKTHSVPDGGYPLEGWFYPYSGNWNVTSLDGYTVFTTTVGSKNRRTNNGDYAVHVTGNLTISKDANDTNKYGSVLVRVKPTLEALAGVGDTTGTITNIGDRFKVIGATGTFNNDPVPFVTVYNSIYGFRIPRENADTQGVTVELRHNVDQLYLQEWRFTDRGYGDEFGLGNGHNFEIAIFYDCSNTRKDTRGNFLDDDGYEIIPRAYFGSYYDGIESTMDQEPTIFDEASKAWFTSNEGSSGIINVSNDITFRAFLSNDVPDERGNLRPAIILQGTSYKPEVKLVAALARRGWYDDGPNPVFPNQPFPYLTDSDKAVNSYYVVPAYKVYTFTRTGSSSSSDDPIQQSTAAVTITSGDVLVDGEGSSVSFVVEGMRQRTGTQSALPTLVNGAYVYLNGAAEDEYVMKDSGGQDTRVNNVKVVLFDGAVYAPGVESHDITDFTTTQTDSGTLFTVSESALRGTGTKYAATKQLAVLATKVDTGKQIMTDLVSVTLLSSTAGRTSLTADSLNSRVTIGESAQQFFYDINYSDLNIGVASADAIQLLPYNFPSWLKFDGRGDVISYTIDPTAIPASAVGTKTYNVLAYVGDDATSNTHARLYTFTVTVNAAEVSRLTVSPASLTLSTTGESETIQFTVSNATSATRGFTIYNLDNAPSTLLSSYRLNIVGNDSARVTANSEGVSAGTYRYHVEYDAILSADFRVVVELPPSASLTIDVAEDYPSGFESSPIEGYTYRTVLSAAAADFSGDVPAIEWSLDTGNMASELYGYQSGDYYVVEGIAKRQVVDDENVDQTFTVNAKAGDVSAEPFTTTFTVEEDANEEVTYPNVGDITFTGSSEAVTTGYRAMFPVRTTTTTELVTLPGWLKPVYEGDPEDDVVIGVEFAGVAGSLENGAKATVRIEAEYTADEENEDDEDATRYYGWDVVYAAAPAKLELTAAPTSLTIRAGETGTATLTVANAQGDVTYTANQTWVTFSGNTAIFAPTEAGSYTVTITATDAGRTTGNTAEATVEVTVPSSGGDTPTPAFGVTATPTTLNVAAGRTATVTLAPANAQGTVSYRASQTWVTFSGNTATFAPTTAGTYTVTITATDAGRTTGNTATATVAVTVTDGGTHTPVESGDFALTTTRNVSLNLATLGGNTSTITLAPANALGAVSYTYTVTPSTGLTVSISGNSATLTAEETGTYTVVFTATDAGRTTGNTATFTTTVTVSSGIVSPDVRPIGSSGGGCDAGFGALALVLAAPLFLRRRRS